MPNKNIIKYLQENKDKFSKEALVQKPLQLYERKVNVNFVIWIFIATIFAIFYRIVSTYRDDLGPLEIFYIVPLIFYLALLYIIKDLLSRPRRFHFFFILFSILSFFSGPIIVVWDEEVGLFIAFFHLFVVISYVIMGFVAAPSINFFKIIIKQKKFYAFIVFLIQSLSIMTFYYATKSLLGGI